MNKNIVELKLPECLIGKISGSIIKADLTGLLKKHAQNFGNENAILEHIKSVVEKPEFAFPVAYPKFFVLASAGENNTFKVIEVSFKQEAYQVTAAYTSTKDEMTYRTEVLTTIKHEDKPKLNAAGLEIIPDHLVKHNVGKKDTLKTPTGSYAVRYAVIPEEYIVTSHDPWDFKKNPDYPAFCQERAYHSDKSEQMKVMQNAKNFDPRFVVMDAPTAVDGAPVVVPYQDKFIVMGGNSRAMTIKRVLKESSKYSEYLWEHRKAFDLKSDRFIYPNGILVRVLDGEFNENTCAKLSRELNETFTQAKDQNAEASSLARSISQSTLDNLSAALEEFDSLAEFFNSPKSRNFINDLRADGIITKNNANKWLLSNGGFTDEAKDIILKSLVAQIVTDKDHLAIMGKTLLNKIAYVIPQLINLRSTEWDLSEEIRKIVLLNIKASGMSTEAYLAQSQMFEKIELSAIERILAPAFENLGVRKLKEKFIAFLGSAKANTGENMFGNISKGEAILKIFGDGIKHENPSKLKRVKVYPVKEGDRILLKFENGEYFRTSSFKESPPVWFRTTQEAEEYIAEYPNSYEFIKCGCKHKNPEEPTKRWVSLADTAKLIRQDLKRHFPGIKFQVRSKSYSGGSSINVRWTDGPVQKDVESVIKVYEGAEFDGMIDLKSYVDREMPDGTIVHYGVDYVFANREYSNWHHSVVSNIDLRKKPTIGELVENWTENLRRGYGHFSHWERKDGSYEIEAILWLNDYETEKYIQSFKNVGYKVEFEQKDKRTTIHLYPENRKKTTGIPIQVPAKLENPIPILAGVKTALNFIESTKRITNPTGSLIKASELKPGMMLVETGGALFKVFSAKPTKGKIEVSIDTSDFALSMRSKTKTVIFKKNAKVRVIFSNPDRLNETIEQAKDLFRKSKKSRDLVAIVFKSGKSYGFCFYKPGITPGETATLADGKTKALVEAVVKPDGSVFLTNPAVVNKQLDAFGKDSPDEVDIPIEHGLALIAKASVINLNMHDGERQFTFRSSDLYATADGRWLIITPKTSLENKRAKVSHEAVRMYENFNHYEFDKTKSLNLPLDKGLVPIGRITAIEYRSDKMIYKSDQKTGAKERDFVHRFTDPSEVYKIKGDKHGKYFIIGRMSKPVTDRGIEA